MAKSEFTQQAIRLPSVAGAAGDFDVVFGVRPATRQGHNVIQFDLRRGHDRAAQVAGAGVAFDDRTAADRPSLGVELPGPPQCPGAVTALPLPAKGFPSLFQRQRSPIVATGLPFPLGIAVVDDLAMGSAPRSQLFAILFVVHATALSLLIGIVGSIAGVPCRLARPTLALALRELGQRAGNLARSAEANAAVRVELRPLLEGAPFSPSPLQSQAPLAFVVARRAPGPSPRALVARLRERLDRQGLSALFATLHTRDYSRHLSGRVIAGGCA